MFVRPCAVATACAVAMLATIAAADPIATAPAGNAFYQPPSPLASGEPGSVIWARPFEGTMALPSAGQNLLALYRSSDADGQIVAVSGTIAIPSGTPPKGGWPVISWAHGTTGLAPVCAPSRDTEGGPEHAYIADIRKLLDGFVKQGYAVVASDYQGLGTPGPHPFLQGIPTGRNTLDMVRAARAAVPQIGARYAVMGHSQGGQVGLFAAAQAPTYAPELTLVGNVAMAPGSHIAERLDTVMKSSKVELALPYLLYALQSFATNHPQIDLSRILTEQALAHLTDLKVGCMSRALTVGYWSSAIAKDQFVAEPDLSALLKVAAQNEPGSLRIAAPTMVMQGTGDVTVPPQYTLGTVRRLCGNGNTVAYRTYRGVDHDGVMAAGASEAHRWLAARFAGSAAANDCALLSSATK